MIFQSQLGRKAFAAVGTELLLLGCFYICDCVFFVIAAFRYRLGCFGSLLSWRGTTGGHRFVLVGVVVGGWLLDGNGTFSFGGIFGGGYLFGGCGFLLCARFLILAADKFV